MTPPTPFKLAMLFAAVAALGACGGGSSIDPATAAATNVSARSERLTPQAIFTPTSGIWWNPQESGRGFTFELQGTQIFMAMYTYETTGAATWYAATLTQQTNGSFTGTLDRYSGGQSLTGSYRAPTLGGKVADITLTFSSATAASLLIQPSDGSAAKTVPLERFVFSAAASTGTFQSGYWWNESQSGRGFLIDAQGSTATIASYMYDSAGQPLWYLMTATIGTNGTRASGNLQQYANGQSLTGTYRAASVLSTSPGAVTLVATSATTANLTLLPTSRCQMP
jgi:hypothetical protein